MNTTQSGDRDRSRLWTLVMILLGCALLAPIVATAEDAAAERRVSESSQYQGKRGRLDPDAAPIVQNRDEFAGGLAKLPGQGQAKKRLPASSSPSAAYTPNSEFWFYSADVELFRDVDDDGYYAGIDLLFDADTIFEVADVYAVLYLSLDGGDWVEYAATDDFTIYDTSGGDSYNVVTDLVDGYPTGSYDILVELFDAWTGEFVAWIGPEDTSELAFLPLEDRSNDAPIGGGTTVVVNRGGGGVAGLPFVVLLAGILIARRLRQEPAAS